MTTFATTSTTAHHGLAAHEVVLLLETDPHRGLVLAKGAVERMLDLCGAQLDINGKVRPLERAAVLRAADDLAARGPRVLATGMRPAAGRGGDRQDEFGEDTLAGGLVLTGLQAMLDPPRAAAAAAVAAWRIGLFSNRWILVGVTVQAVGQLALTYLPAMNTIFGTAPIGGDVWLRILAIAVAASLVVAIDKRLRRGRA